MRVWCDEAEQDGDGWVSVGYTGKFLHRIKWMYVCGLGDLGWRLKMAGKQFVCSWRVTERRKIAFICNLLCCLIFYFCVCVCKWILANLGCRLWKYTVLNLKHKYESQFEEILIFFLCNNIVKLQVTQKKDFPQKPWFWSVTRQLDMTTPFFFWLWPSLS